MFRRDTEKSETSSVGLLRQQQGNFNPPTRISFLAQTFQVTLGISVGTLDYSMGRSMVEDLLKKHRSDGPSLFATTRRIIYERGPDLEAAGEKSGEFS